jgi:hypothetical protein
LRNLYEKWDGILDYQDIFDGVGAKTSQFHNVDHVCKRLRAWPGLGELANTLAEKLDDLRSINMFKPSGRTNVGTILLKNWFSNAEKLDKHPIDINERAGEAMALVSMVRVSGRVRGESV